MKIRVGFVSNSSSSSFVVDKAVMTGEQIREFVTLIRKHNKEDYEDGYLYEGKNHYFGEISIYADYIFNFLDKNKIEYESMS